jgi:hypothetical protein
MKKRFNIIILLLSFITLMLGTLMVIIPFRSFHLLKGTLVEEKQQQPDSILIKNQEAKSGHPVHPVLKEGSKPAE